MSKALRPVLFIPSQLLTHALWAPQIAALGEICAPVLADHTQDATIGAMAGRALAAAPATFDLVAQGMGGFVAFEILRRAPERVRSLVLIGTLAAADGPAQAERRRGYSRLVEAGRFAEVIEQRIPLLLGPKRVDDPDLSGQVRAMAEATGAETFLRQQAAIIARIDSRPFLPQIGCPALILRGAHDGITSAEHHAELADLIPRATGETVADCGHLPTLETPDVMTWRLRAWLLAQRGT